jgi:hypothetical protein
MPTQRRAPGMIAKLSKDNRVQARDNASGLPLWMVEALEFGPVA